MEEGRDTFRPVGMKKVSELPIRGIERFYFNAEMNWIVFSFEEGEYDHPGDRDYDEFPAFSIHDIGCS